MDLRSQKKLSARLLKCGQTRVWFEPSRGNDIAEAITADDIRKLIRDGVIREIPKSGNSRFRIKKNLEQKRKGRRKNKGSRKGTLETRLRKKETWMKRIRAIRKLLVQLKTDGKIDGPVYRSMYIKAKSGLFRSKSHVTIYLERNNLLKGSEKNVQPQKK